MARANELGLKTVVAKRIRGRYCPGEKTRDWVNVKPATARTQKAAAKGRESRVRR
jgi:ATP-dependent DNA ligase